MDNHAVIASILRDAQQLKDKAKGDQMNTLTLNVKCGETFHEKQP